jgi:signal transduction histidine kinase
MDGFAMSTSPTDGPNATLDALLNSWQDVSQHLEQAHRSLSQEVQRLRGELASSNAHLAEQQRFADLGAAAAQLANDLRQRLEPVHHYLSLLKERLGEDPGGSDVLDKALAGFGELESTIEDLYHYAAQREPAPELLSVHDLIYSVRSTLATQLTSQGITLVVDVPEEAHVCADREWLERAVHNLMLNALEAMPKGGELVITAVEGEELFELEIADSGPCLNGGTRGGRFEPFFQAPNSRAGLRLAVVHDLLERAGGSATAMNCPEGGAAFTLRIPHRAAAAQAKAA